MKLAKIQKLTQFEKSEKGFYALILTLASQTCLERAIRCFERRERIEPLRVANFATRSSWNCFLAYSNLFGNCSRCRCRTPPSVQFAHSVFWERLQIQDWVLLPALSLPSLSECAICTLGLFGTTSFLRLSLRLPLCPFRSCFTNRESKRIWRPYSGGSLTSSQCQLKRMVGFVTFIATRKRTGKPA